LSVRQVTNYNDRVASLGRVAEGLTQLALALAESEATNRRLAAELADATAAIRHMVERFGPQSAPRSLDLAGSAPFPTPAAGGASWRALLEAYMEANADRVSSANSDRGRAAHLTRILGDVVVSETNEATLRHYRAVRATETTKRKAMPSAKTLNNEIELARRAARWGYRQRKKLVPCDPFADMLRADVFLPVENVRRNVVEDDPGADGGLTLERFLALASPLDRALVLVAHSSGMRRGEMAALEMAWIDRTPDAKGRPLRIVQIPPGVAKGKKGKRKGRQTWISVEALDALDAYRKTWPFPLQRRCPWAFANTVQHKDGRPGSYYGQHLHKDYLTERFRNLQEKSKAAGPSGPAWLHDLRRSFITLARRRGESTSNIRQASGHLTEAAFERYDIHSRQDAIVVRDRVEAARDRDLAALSEQRRGPKRSEPGASTCGEKNNTG
jgi:integrase